MSSQDPLTVLAPSVLGIHAFEWAPGVSAPPEMLCELPYGWINVFFYSKDPQH